MFRSINLAERCVEDYKHRKESKEQYTLIQKHIEKFKKIALKVIKYPDYKEAFDYVDNLFPRVKVKDISIYKVASKDLIRMGFCGVEGFYDSISKNIIISGYRKPVSNIDKKYCVTAKIESDEVIVHELCHLCYYAEGKRSISSEMREEFAYGWSVGYLRQKGYTDEQIIKYNFLPYLIGLAMEEATKNILVQNGINDYEYRHYSRYQKKKFQKRYFGKIINRSKEIATERGLKLINLYSKKIEEGTGCTNENDEFDRFEILDL